MTGAYSSVPEPLSDTDIDHGAPSGRTIGATLVGGVGAVIASLAIGAFRSNAPTVSSAEPGR